MKVFVSLPMGNKKLDEIKSEQLDIFLRFIYNKNAEAYEFVESALPEPADIDVDPNVWCLGRSIQLMAESDIVIFARDWRDARGCRIEHAICELYQIPHLYDCYLEEDED